MTFYHLFLNSNLYVHISQCLARSLLLFKKGVLFCKAEVCYGCLAWIFCVQKLCEKGSLPPRDILIITEMGFFSKMFLHCITDKAHFLSADCGMWSIFLWTSLLFVFCRFLAIIVVCHVLCFGKSRADLVHCLSPQLVDITTFNHNDKRCFYWLALA